MTSRPFDSVGSGSEEQKYRLPRAHCRRGKPHMFIVRDICRLGERGDPVSFAPRTAVSASRDCKLAGNRVDPVSIVVVDAASFFILICREMQSGECQL